MFQMIRRVVNFSNKLMTNFEKFMKYCKEGPVYSCCSCLRLLYKHSVLRYNELKLQHVSQSLILKSTDYSNKEYICSTCFNSLEKLKMSQQ